MDTKWIEKLSNVDHKRCVELVKLSSLINSSLDLNEVLQKVMEITNKLVNSDASSLLLYDEKDKNLFFSATTGTKANEIKNFKLKLGQGIAGWVAEKRRPLIIPNVSEDTRHYNDADDLIDYEPISMICVPMLKNDRLIGVLQAMHSSQPDFFSQEDLTILFTLSNYASLAIENAKKHNDISQENSSLKKVLQKNIIPIYKSKEIEQIYNVAKKVARGNSTVLIRGKSGTGKEMLARYIHFSSARKNKPFICVTCSILSETLLESELFGHEKGSFTGAENQRIGKFEKAHNGTLFLDEIGTLSLETQLRLLRVLQEKEIERVGGSETIPIDVRILAATNENLEQAIEKGKFREDLYYRLKVIEIMIPNLKDRPADIIELSNYFLKLMAEEIGRPIKGISKEALNLIKNYPWPGNVRELKNAIERTIVLGVDEWIQSEDLPHEVKNYQSTQTSDKTSQEASDSLETAEKNQIIRVLQKTNSNKSKAAKILGISRNRLDRKIESYKI